MMSDNDNDDYPKGWNPDTQSWDNLFWRQWNKDKEGILQYQRDNNWKRAYQRQKARRDLYIELCNDPYVITLEGLIPYRKPFKRLLLKYRWLHQWECYDDDCIKVNYHFDKRVMTPEKEDEFRRELNIFINKKK